MQMLDPSLQMMALVGDQCALVIQKRIRFFAAGAGERQRRHGRINACTGREFRALGFFHPGPHSLCLQ